MFVAVLLFLKSCGFREVTGFDNPLFNTKKFGDRASDYGHSLFLGLFWSFKDLTQNRGEAQKKIGLDRGAQEVPEWCQGCQGVTSQHPNFSTESYCIPVDHAKGVDGEDIRSHIQHLHSHHLRGTHGTPSQNE